MSERKRRGQRHNATQPTTKHTLPPTHHILGTRHDYTRKTRSSPCKDAPNCTLRNPARKENGPATWSPTDPSPFAIHNHGPQTRGAEPRALVKRVAGHRAPSDCPRQTEVRMGLGLGSKTMGGSAILPTLGLCKRTRVAHSNINQTHTSTDGKGAHPN